MTAEQEPRELTPVQMFWDGSKGFKDLSPHPVKVVDEEVAQAEEAMTPVPKDESALVSALSKDSAASIEPSALESPALPDETTTESPEDADKESGKLSESSADVPPTPLPPTPSPAPSLPASSSQTSPGKSKPPAPVKPPTSA